MLVVLVMALATILAYSLLSGSAVQATAGANAVAAATARAQAESGIHLAMYYILNPANAPATFWNNTTSNITFSTVSPAATIPGSVSIQIGAPTNGCYPVTAVGSSGSSVGGGAVTRTISAEICAGSTFSIQQAAAFNGPLVSTTLETFSSTGAAALISTGAITGSAHVSGNIEASSVQGSVVQSSGSVTGAPSVAPAPNTGTVTNYSLPYVYQGVEYYPTLIGSSITTAVSYGATPSNPLGIYYTSGNLSVSKALTINGTLVVGGTLTNSSSINITPIATQLTTNYPAMVVGSKLTMSGHTATLNATGVVYVASGITGVTTNSSTDITVNGALLVTANAISSYSGTMSVNYNAAYTNIPNFASSNTTPCVKIISWSE